MKKYQQMKVATVGTVTEVVMGGHKHSGRDNNPRNKNKRNKGGQRPGFGPR